MKIFDAWDGQFHIRHLSGYAFRIEKCFSPGFCLRCGEYTPVLLRPRKTWKFVDVSGAGNLRLCPDHWLEFRAVFMRALLESEI